MATPLQQLGEHGQSVWLDFISRDLVTSGELERRVADENVTGMTSNPTIFQKAIAEGSLYDDQIRELIESGVDDPKDVFTELAITDIQHAADILRPVHERTSGRRRLRQPRGTAVAVARHRRNRRDGEDALGAGRPSQPHDQDPGDARRHAGDPPDHRRRPQRQRHAHLRDRDARARHRAVHQRALEARHRDGQLLDVHSVASFFVSRVDTLVDKLLEEKLAADPGNALIEGPARQGGDRQRGARLRALRTAIR